MTGTTVAAAAVRPPLRAYRAYARISARTVLTYRLNFALGLFGLLFQLLALLSIWGVLLRAGNTVGGFSWPQMKAYLLIAYGTNAIASSFGDMRMGFRIREGLVAIDLTKPVDFQRARFAETSGVAVVELATTAGICALVVGLAGPVSGPAPGQTGLFLLSLLPLLPLKFCTVYLAGLACFWTQNTFGVSLTRVAVTNLFSGALVPLALLPGWLQATAGVLPFASITATPAALYLGTATGTEALRLLAVQLAWAVGLWFGCRLIWRVAVRKLTVHGG